MPKNKEYSFSNLTTRYLLTLLLLLLSVLLIWIYSSTNRSLKEQQNLNVNFNNRNSTLVLNALQTQLKETLKETANEISSWNNSQGAPDDKLLITALQKSSIPNLDFLRFVSPDGETRLNADSPFYDFIGIDKTISGKSRQYLGESHLVQSKTADSAIWMILSAQRIVQQKSGKVLGILMGGIVINNNMQLAREIIDHSNAEYAVLQVNENVIAASKQLNSSITTLVESTSGAITRTSVHAENQTKRKIIGRYNYYFSNDIPLTVVLIHQDTLYSDMQRTFISSGVLLIITTIGLFIVFFRFSNRMAKTAVNNLVSYIENLRLDSTQTHFHTGQIKEFNLVGKAIEQMVTKLNEATEALKETQERMELVVQGADLATWDWDVNSGHVILNDRWAEMLGYNPNNIQPEVNSWKDRVHPDDWEYVSQILEDHLGGKTEYYSVEHRLRHRNGKWVWILAAGKVVDHDSSGKPARVVGIHMDINRRKEVEKELIKERALLASLIDSIPDLIFYKDPESIYLGCNAAFEKLTGKSREQIVGKTDMCLFPIEQAEFFREKDRLMLSSGKSMRNEEWVTYPDGHKELLDTLKTPFLGPENKLLGLIGISRDITKIKETENNLADERERLAVTLRSIADGVITTDTHGAIVLLNKVAEELTGWTTHDAIGKPFNDIFTVIDKNTGKTTVNLAQEILRKGNVNNLTHHKLLISKNGTRSHIANSGAPIRDRDGNIIGAVVVFRDVTNEQRMEEELLKVTKLESIGVLAGGIAHDFNNILSAILGNIELISLLADNENSKIKTLITSAQKATIRATKLTQQLLTFSKGGDPLKESTLLPDLIRESADFVLHGSRIHCSYSFPDNLWSVDADGGQISQVIQNIIINAKHSMPEGGQIKVSGRNIEDISKEPLLLSSTVKYVHISIADSGVGIPLEIIDKIFDPYFTTKQDGSGLGLAICHSIIRKHDGQLTVKSNLGNGTVFDIYLPKSSSSPDSQTSMQALSQPSRKCRILVMDDEEMILDVASEQLESLGHTPVLAASGEQALELYRENKEAGTSFDVVIMDLTIRGGMGGQEASQKMIEYDPSAKIIVASGYSNDPVIAKYIDFGFCAALVKPFDLQKLTKILEKVIT